MQEDNSKYLGAKRAVQRLEIKVYRAGDQQMSDKREAALCSWRAFQNINRLTFPTLLGLNRIDSLVYGTDRKRIKLWSPREWAGWMRRGPPRSSKVWNRVVRIKALPLTAALTPSGQPAAWGRHSMRGNCCVVTNFASLH